MAAIAFGLLFLFLLLLSVVSKGYTAFQQSMITIPVGTAYAVWTATGAALTVVWAMVRGTEPATLKRILLLLGIVACVIGLKVVG